MLDASAKARNALEGIALAVGRGLGRAGITPNAITALGVGLTVLAAWQVVARSFLVAGVVLIAAGVLDFLDGAVARATGRSTTLGALLDSIADRVSDAVVLSAVAWVLIADANVWVASAALVALGAAQLTSYIRAKAESLDYTCKVGIMERAERLVVIITGLVFGVLEAAIVLLAVASTVTVLQRLVHVGRQAHARG